MSVVLRLIRPGRSTTILRRLLSHTGVVLGALIAWAGLPLWIAILLLCDLVRDGLGPRRFILTRILLFAAGWLACEVAGLGVALGIWLRALVTRPDPDTYRSWNFRLQCEWGHALLRIGQTTFGYRFEVTGADVVTPGPILLLLRHTSLADTVLAVSQISRPHDMVLRYVLKRPLLLDPCIDVVGRRLINYFALRGEKSRSQFDGVAALADDLGPKDGILLYPEGTRYTQEKKSALLRKLERRKRADDLAYAEGLQHVLPPIRGGFLAVLERCDLHGSTPDVVFCAHAGFEGSATAKDLLAGRLLGTKVKIHFWRVPGEEIPSGTEEREAWLRAQWQRMDRTVEALRRGEIPPRD